MGVIRGRRPLIVLFCHSRNLLSGIHIFRYCGPLIEPFRGDDKRMIEAFRNDGYGDDRAFRGDRDHCGDKKERGLQGGKLFSSPALRKHHLGVVVDAGVLELIWLEER